ncbi:flagellar biosynthesis protein FlhF [Colwellia sp. D2M02]|uniref:Flagellar biosynthesis protein FlhF n=1 Tax=Colwellia asteriadis TaxID=517723 RepID=A0ABN1L5V7_9GAMM|nr:flagellar biosynthesis protein FlhF [Colwellia sp. D2M02]MBU2893208.1 flagellar biosynthesis protein FlhF [Colwellia sp. D2M02]
MKIKRFVAKDMRSALAQIKDELGVDAVIMSTKKIPEGVELMAAVDYNQPITTKTQPQEQSLSANSINSFDERSSNRAVTDDVVNIGNHASHSQSASTRQNSVASENVTVNEKVNSTANEENHADSLSALLNRQVQQTTTPMPSHSQPTVNDLTEEDESIEQQFKSFTDRLSQSTVLNEDADDITANVTPFNAQQTVPTESQSAAVSSQDFAKMQQEMMSIRALLEHQVSGLMWQDMAQKDPQRAVLVSRLLALGINEQIADQIAGYVPPQTSEPEAWQQATQLIAKQINTTQNDIIHRGGVVALVGPTGVGKTTTIAKLAAGFAQVHGSDNVALISTDTFRIAGFEQLATYGKIIGCQVMLAKDSQALDALLQQFSKKKLILIDTAGMGQRDMRLAEQLANLVNNARVTIRNYLVLAANTQQRVMQENVERFKKVPISGCIYTKLDESVSIGEIITTSIKNGLPIGYLTDGQRVPEDIKVANAEKLVTLADKMASKPANGNNTPVRTMPVAPAGVM